MTRIPSAWLACLALVLLTDRVAIAQQAPAPARYVTVNVEVHGLDESTRVLAGAARTLAATLEELKGREKDLTPAQLERLAALAREMSELVRAAERAVQETDRALEKAREPVKRIVTDAVSAAREAGVDPVLRSVHGSVTTWLVIAVLGGLAALALSLYVFFSVGRQLREAATALKSIAADYEIVRRAPDSRVN